eukprot:COSAG03_NODE_1547_length_3896_cov_1.627601_2_plen_52_part_00
MAVGMAVGMAAMTRLIVVKRTIPASVFLAFMAAVRVGDVNVKKGTLAPTAR